MQLASLLSRRTMMPFCALLLLLLSACLLVVVSAQPQALEDGVPSFILPTIQTNYFYFDVCDAAKNTHAASTPSASDAPVTLAWTNLTNLTPSNPYSSLNPFSADLYVSFVVADPSPTNFEFRSRSGMLSIPAASVRGCTLYLAVVVPDVAFMNGTTQYGIVAQRDAMIQLTECVPQRWVSQSNASSSGVSLGAQFSLQSQPTPGSAQTVAFTAASASSTSQFTLWAGTKQPLTSSTAQWQLGPNEQQVLYANDPNWPADGVFFLSIEAPTAQPFVLITNGNAGWCSTGFGGEGRAAAEDKPRAQVGNDPNNPALLTDGGVFSFPALEPSAGGFFYLDLKLHSYLAEALSLPSIDRPQIPPLVCAFTDLSSPPSAGPAPAPAIWGSWGWNAPNNASFDVASASGVLVVSNDTVVGQYQLNLALQWDAQAGAAPGPFSFGCQIFNALQVAAASPLGQPQSWQSVWVETGGSVSLQQFVATLPTSLGSCPLRVSLPLGAESGLLSLFLSDSPQPTPINYLWTSNGSPIQIAASDPQYPRDQLYVAVGVSEAASDDVAFELRVDLLCSADEEQQLGAIVDRVALE